MLPAVTPSIIGVSIFMSPPKKSADGIVDRVSSAADKRRGEVFEQRAVGLDRVVRPQRTRDRAAPRGGARCWTG